MAQRLVKFIFFGNYFIGLLAVGLTLECLLQLKLPLPSYTYFGLLLTVPVIYYTYAYMNVTRSGAPTNPRSVWYAKNATFIKRSQLVLSVTTCVLVCIFIFYNTQGILSLPIPYWLFAGIVLLVSMLYYGLLPSFFFNLNLRNTGWLKPIVIGFVWAATANLFPLLVLKIERGMETVDSTIWIYLFIKNWMFCTANAIMFDMKDYAIDYNHQLKTFVVRMGLKKTIFLVLIPLLFTGMAAFLVFSYIEDFPVRRIIINLLPFLLTLGVAYSMNKKRNIFYYLIVIDGLIFIKALCGIISMLLILK